MPNPHPVQTEELKEKWFQRQSGLTLADTQTQIRLPTEPVNVKGIIDALPKKTKAIRLRVIIIKGLQAEGLLTEAQVESLLEAISGKIRPAE